MNKYIYVNYVDEDDYTIVSRFTCNNKNANKYSEEILLKIKQPYSNHNGGCITFGSDDFLYIAMGDGGSSGDPENRSQDNTNLFGTILRIDVNTDKGYVIPKSNPFYNNNDFKPEIFMYGLRNPWRFTFDSLTGDMFIGDVGQNLWEEINFIPNSIIGGQNFGWNKYEGNHCYPYDFPCENDNYTMPVFEYPNNAKYAKTLFGIKQPEMDGCSVTGGYVYRGAMEKYFGRYFFGDYCTGKIWSFIMKNGIASDLQNHTNEILNSMNKKEFYLSSFGESNNKELFIIDYNGSVYKLINVK